MIFDNVKNADKYYACHPKFKAAFEFINSAINENYAPDSYHLEGAEMYAFIQEYTSKTPDETQFEGHKNYIDIQCVVSGIECMEGMDIDRAVVKVPYDSEKDVCFYEDDAKAVKAVLEAGDFGIFFPHDVHKPGMGYMGEKAAVKKIVVKVHI